MIMSNLHATPRHDDGHDDGTMRDAKASVLMCFFIFLIVPAVLTQGRSLALKAGLIGGGVFGAMIIASVHMCWRLGYIQALMENEPSRGQQQ